MYGDGENETIVGAALRDRRDDVILCTKFHNPVGDHDDPNRRGNSRRWIMTAVEDSLRRLGTDRIDLYQVHRPDPDTAIDETVDALTDLVRAGKIRAWGTSTFPAEEIVEAQWAAERRSAVSPPTANSRPYSIFSRGIEADVLPVAQRYGMGVLTWSPLAGRLAHRQVPARRHHTVWQPRRNQPGPLRCRQPCEVRRRRGSRGHRRRMPACP